MAVSNCLRWVESLVVAAADKESEGSVPAGCQINRGIIVGALIKGRPGVDMMVIQMRAPPAGRIRSVGSINEASALG